MVWELLYTLTAKLFHDLLELAVQDCDGVVSTATAECRGSVHDGPPQHRKLGADCHCPGNVWTTAETQFHHDRYLLAEFLDNRAKWRSSALGIVGRIPIPLFSQLSLG